MNSELAAAVAALQPITDTDAEAAALDLLRQIDAVVLPLHRQHNNAPTPETRQAIRELGDLRTPVEHALAKYRTAVARAARE